MAGATIDHLVSLTVFLAALLLFIGFFNQMNQTAVVYQYHRYIASECSDTLDSILLNPGTPSNWGVSGSSTQNLTFFGLQDPDFQQYQVSSFSVMRLLTSANQIYYNQTGQWYNNVVWGSNGAYLLLRTNTDCINYHNAISMLGINGTYDFQLLLTPTLTINVTQVSANDLKLKIQAYGSGFPVSNAYLNYLIFWANSSSGGFPVMNSNFTSDIIQTDSSGIAYKEFPSLSNNTAFTFIVKVSVAGLSGVGYLSQATVTSTGNIIPYIQGFDNGTMSIVLAQKYGQNDPPLGMGNLYYNATFYALPNTFTPIAGGTLTGNVNSTTPYQNLNITLNNQTGFLVVAYGNGTYYGTVIAPLGINSIGVPVTFGSNISAKEWVATDLRQVTIGDIAYQAKLSFWSLKGFQGGS